jgi:hypothetical protein
MGRPHRYTYTEYLELLRSPRWQALRRDALARAGFQCERVLHWRDWRGDPVETRCPNTANLQAHHISYDNLGNETLADVQVYCDGCHKITHLLSRWCIRCEEPVFDTDEDAVRHLAIFDADELRYAMDNCPQLCSWCQKMADGD